MRHFVRRISVFAAAFILLVAASDAAVKLPGFFTDNMVLQREKPVPIWGWADPGEKVEVSFGKQSVSVKADENGKWKVSLKPMKASKDPQILKVNGKELKNIVVGDVWLCSGQSNMEWIVKACANPREEAKAANYPLIRHVKFKRTHGITTSDDIKSRWEVCSPRTVPDFTAVGYYFGRRLHKELDVPIGLIGSNWGGTRIEPWIPPEGFVLVPELKGENKKLAERMKFLATMDPTTEAGKKNYTENIGKIKAWIQEAEVNVASGKVPAELPKLSSYPKIGHQDLCAIYNKMIHPIVGYAIRGAIWYQGESNGREGVSYFHKKKALIEGWRKIWDQGDFPFYFVQLADFQGNQRGAEGGDGWAKLREAQRQSLTIKNTGMAVIHDIGNKRDVHPKNKQDVGHRLAQWALVKEFGRDIVPSGPLYKDMKIDGNKIIISFDHVGKGLMVGKKDGMKPTEEVKNGKLEKFAIAGSDKKWHWATAEIKGDTVVVSCPEVAEPAAVRYGFMHNPRGANLYNKEGFPASSFRTDNW